MKQQKEKRPTVGRKYNKLGSIVWALKKLWSLDRKFVFFIFATVPVAVALPLVQSYFSKVLIDSIGLGTGLAEVVSICAGFSLAILALRLLKDFINFRCYARQYYPTMVIQNELGAIAGYHTDYENTEKQEFEEICGYAVDDSCRGDCSVEWVWKDISKVLTNALGIITYGSLLAFINPVVFLIVAAVSVLSYFTTRWQTTYREKHKHEWEKEVRKVTYLQDLSDNFPVAKDIKLYGMEGWLEKMLRDYQAYVFMWNKRCSLRGAWASVLAAVMTLIQDGCAYIYLVVLLLDGSISVGDFVFYFSAIGSIAAFLTGIVSDVATLNSRAEKIAYYRNVYDYPNSFNHGAGCALPTSAVKIEFKDSQCSFPDYGVHAPELPDGNGCSRG